MLQPQEGASGLPKYASETSRRLRLAFYIHAMEGGGAERVFALIASELAKQGQDIELILDHARGPNMALLAKEVRVVDLNCPARKAVVRLRNHLKSARPDVVFVGLPHSNLIAAAALRGLNIPFVATVHSVTGLGHVLWTGTGLLTTAGIALEPLVFHAASAIGVVSGAISDAKGMAKRYGRKTHILYNPVDLTRFSPLPSQQTSPLDDPAPASKPGGARKLIICAGRMAPPKDFATVLRAFAILEKETPADLLLLGEGPQRPQIEALARALNLNRVAMPGYASDIETYLRACDLLVVSSKSEGFANTIIEAWACGAPVLAADCPGAPRELIAPFDKDALTPVGDAERMAKAMASMLAAPRAPAALRARAAPFSTQICAERYLDVARSVSSRAQTSPG